MEVALDHAGTQLFLTQASWGYEHRGPARSLGCMPWPSRTRDPVQSAQHLARCWAVKAVCRGTEQQTDIYLKFLLFSCIPALSVRAIGHNHHDLESSSVIARSPLCGHGCWTELRCLSRCGYPDVQYSVFWSACLYSKGGCII